MKERMRAMEFDSGFPANLWPVTLKAASYLHNRTPRQQNDWKTPWELWNKWLKEESKDSNFKNLPDDLRPPVFYLRTYGCRAYTMTAEAKAEE